MYRQLKTIRNRLNQLETNKTIKNTQNKLETLKNN